MLDLDTLIPATLPRHWIAMSQHAWGDEFDDTLFEEEGIHYPENIQKAVLKRRREYFYGRLCARNAVRQLRPGFDDVIGTNPDRSPIWPSGIAGSITHNHHRAICVCGDAGHLASVGIDAEAVIAEKTANNIASQILLPDEQPLKGLDTWTFAEQLTLVFSAKESFYKAVYPWVKKIFGFECVVIRAVDPASGTFELEVTEDLHPRWRKTMALTGQFTYRRAATALAEIVTAVIIPA